MMTQNLLAYSLLAAGLLPFATPRLLAESPRPIPDGASAFLEVVETRSPDPPAWEHFDRRSAQSATRPKTSPSGTEIRVFENVSGRLITAWQYSCVIATSSGRSTILSRGADGYRIVGQEEFFIAPGSDVVGLISPEGRVEVEVPAAELPEDGPFAGQTCGFTALVFADGATWGAPQHVRSIVERRLLEIDEVDRLVKRLNELGPEGGPADATTFEKLREALPADRKGLYAGHIGRHERAVREGEYEVSEALSVLRDELEQARRRVLEQIPEGFEASVEDVR